ncbi:unnamed protein product [Linum trigynum]|uniref:Retrotransposon gag domain-containing protein n=1 Tax=Linum trigynum TaxID=586398 RepID=A0AAV2FV30_9ROSI
MQLQTNSNAALCRTFPSTFSGICLDWYNRLPNGIIRSFEEFILLFTTKFASQKRRPLHLKALIDIRQKDGESLRAFYARWSRVAMAVRDLTPETAAHHLMDATTNMELKRALAKRPVTLTTELEVGVIARFAWVAYPQANGQAEAANKAIPHGLQTRLDKAKGNWADELNTVLWVHRTTFKVATGETPFALTYGTDAVIPIEITSPTYRVTAYDEADNDEACLLDLELAQERRELATIKLAATKEQVAKYYNKKLVPHKLMLRDQVLRRNFRPDPKHGKLASTWEGPYLIREVVGANTFKLSEFGGIKIPRTWNAQNLRKYYCPN